MLLRLALLILLLSSAACVQAAAWIDVRYDATTDARLDIHAPAAAGPHRVMVWFHGGQWTQGDKTLRDQQAALFNARGYVLVSVDYPLLPQRHPAGVSQAAAAVAYVVRNVARYGGDPGRIHLMGADAGAHLAALLSVDPRWLAVHGLSPASIRGLVLVSADSLDLVSLMQEGRADLARRLDAVWSTEPEQWLDASPLAQLRPDASIPPVLLLDRRGGSTQRARQRERFSDRLRSAGVATQSFLLPVADDAELAVGPALDGLGRDALLAWLDALELPRVARFENLGFSTEWLSAPAAASLGGARRDLQFLTPFDGALWAAQSGDAGRSEILRKPSADADWQPQASFAEGARFTELSAWRLERDGLGAALATAVQLGVTGLVHSNGTISWQWALGDAGFTELTAAPESALRSVQRHRDQVSGGELLLLGSGGAGIRSASWHSASRSLVLNPISEIEGADVVAIVVADGTAYAAINGRSPGLYQRVDGQAPRWLRVSDTEVEGAAPAQIAALVATPDPAGTGRAVLLVAHAGSGHIVRIDPQAGFSRQLEVDLGRAFAEVWQGDQRRVEFGSNRFVALPHPETADQVLAIGLNLSHPLATEIPHNGSWFLLRQADGSYSYGTAYDYQHPPAPGTRLGALRAIASSPFVNDQAAVYVAGAPDSPGAGESAWIYRGALDTSAPRRGLWWDRTHTGHGLDLQPVSGRWMLTLSTYEASGKPVWYAALGDLVNRRFVADGGLTRYDYRLDRNPPQRRNAERSGKIELRFGLAHGEAACADSARDRPDALALAELQLTIDGRRSNWCIEPMRFAEAGLPTADANGLWYAGPADPGWAISITERGVDGRSLGVAHVYYYDDEGQPRWALGTAPVVEGNARYPLRAFRGYCPGCAIGKVSSQPTGEFVQRLSGYCGALSGFGSLDLQSAADPEARFVRSRFPMNRVSTAACY